MRLATRCFRRCSAWQPSEDILQQLFEGVIVESVEAPSRSAKLDLAMLLDAPTGHGTVRGKLEYSADRFDAHTAQDIVIVTGEC